MRSRGRGGARAIEVFCLAAVALASACGVNVAPYVEPVDDKSVAVGLDLQVQINASDPDGDALSFSFNAPELPDLAMRQPPATLMAFSNGVAVFHWIPSGADVRAEPYEIDFAVSDGKSTSGIAVFVTVSQSSGNIRPSFVKPIGSGTTLDLNSAPCLQVPVEVADTDSATVTIAQEDPLIDGAILTQDGAFTATWKWCPTTAQLNGQDRFYLRLSADDGSGQKTLKDPYLIVVISSGGQGCPGAAPQITTTPLTDQTSSNDLAVTMTATDDIGLASAPLLYWSTTDPGMMPMLASMTAVMTTMSSGTSKNGMYAGTIPNPTHGMASGTMTHVYYLLVAHDDDDPTGGCNHTTFAPQTGTYSFLVTAP